jgi:hypothetical protein
VCFRNEGHRPVFLLDGEELVGAKQNRVVNISVLAPLASVLHIPVTCVEQGRWHASSCQMASSEQTLFAQARARKAAQVTASLERDAGAFSDQGTVWADIRGKADRLGSSSATWAMADVYRDQEARMSEYVRSFRDEPRQIGAVYRVGRNLGLELFDSPRTFATPAISRPPRGSGRP